MAGAFDPYREWLGIRDPERPPNFYHLAGVEPSESDPLAIARAADRQMEQLRYHQSGSHAVEAQRILQEVIAAKLCLLDPQRKAEYDTWLHSQIPAASTMPVAAPMMASYDNGYQESVSAMPTTPDAAPIPPTVKLIIGALSGVIVVLLILIGWMAIHRTPPANEPATPVATVTKPATAVRPASAKPNRQPPAPAVSKPETPPAPAAVTEAMPPQSPATETMAPEETSSEPSAESSAMSVDPARSTAEALRAVRTALTSRDLAAANEQLVVATSQVSAAELMELNHLREVLASLNVFWRAVRSGMAEVKPGESLDVKGRKLTVVRGTTEELVAQLGSREVRYTAEDLPATLAMILAERRLPAVPASSMAKATFLTFDPQGDKQLARQWCDQAAKEGLSVAALLAELGPAPVASLATQKTPEKKPAKTLGQKPSKLALPDPANEAAALAEVRKIHRNDFDKAQDSAKKKALARTLLKEALETPDEPAIRFVLLGQARDLAIGAGDPVLLREVTEETAKYYDVDAKEQLIGLLNDVADSRIGTGNKKDLARGALELADEYIAANDYDSAMQLARAAQSMALGRDTAMTKQAVDLIKSLPRLEQEYKRFQQAEKILADDPNNASANLAQGQYYCFVQNTDEAWQKGLPMLTKGSDAKLKTLAEAELSLTRSKSKQESNEWFNLAEQWYEMSRTADEITRESCRSRAAYWYKKAQPKLQGFKEKKAKLRLEELKEE